MSLRNRIRRDLNNTWVMKIVTMDNLKDKQRFFDLVLDMTNDLARKS